MNATTNSPIEKQLLKDAERIYHAWDAALPNDE